MSNDLIFLGLSLWVIAVMLTFIFLTAKDDTKVRRLRSSIKLWPADDTGPKFGTAILQITGILWVIIGIIVKWLGEGMLQGIAGDIALGFIILAPVWIGIFIAEKRRNKSL